MKGKPPSRYFFHDGTQYVLTGNERLAMSHFHELRAHLNLLKMTNVQALPIVFGSKEFDDGTNAKFQLIHGRERINVFAPSIQLFSAEESKEFITEDNEQIIPCMLVVDTFDTPSIVGYIACLSGSFLGPYQYFAAPLNDATTVVEGIIAQGMPSYVEELAFKDNRLLSTAFDGSTLSYVKPSGAVPEGEGRITSNTTVNTIGNEAIEIYNNDGSWLFFEDDIWLYTDAVGTTSLTRNQKLKIQLLLDGNELFESYDNSYLNTGNYHIKLGAGLACGAQYSECREDINALMATEIPNLAFAHSHLNTYKLAENLDYDEERSYIVVNMSNGISTGIRSNESYDKSGFLKVVVIDHEVRDSWNDTGLPSPYNNTTSSSMCSGCYVYTTDIRSSLLYAVIDVAEEHNISTFFEWDIVEWDEEYFDIRLYDYSEPESEAYLVYHKPGENSTPIFLASAIAYLEYASYEDGGEMAYVYVGPSADGVNGSVSFPVANWSEPFINVSEAFPNMFKEDFIGGLMGDVFLGKIKTPPTIKEV